MRVDLCAREDYDTQTRLLEAFGRLGVFPDDDVELEVPLPTGLLRFRAGADVLTVLVDTWGVDLEGPDGLAARVLESMAETG